MSDLVERLRGYAETAPNVAPYKMAQAMREAANALSRIEVERDEAIAETWRQIEGANRQFAVQNSIVHQITDERDKLRELSRDAYRCCMSAWSCGEPLHRVKDMLNAVERLGSHLGEPGAPALHPTDNDRGARTPAVDAETPKGTEDR